MQLNVIRADDSITHLAVHGRLDIQGVSQIERQFVFNTTSRRKATLVDVSRVTFIASLGMGMLVGVAKALHRHGVKLVLCGPPELVRASLEAAGIHHVIPIADEEESALRLLG